MNDYLFAQLPVIRFGDEVAAWTGGSTATLALDGLDWRLQELGKQPEDVRNLLAVFNPSAPPAPDPTSQADVMKDVIKGFPKPSLDLGGVTRSDNPQGSGIMGVEHWLETNGALILLALVLIGLGVWSLLK